MTAPTISPVQPVAPTPEPDKTKKPLYKRVWFWILVVIVVLSIYAISTSGSSSKSASTAAPASSSAPATSSSAPAPAVSSSTPVPKPNPSTAKVEMQATSTGSGTAMWGQAGSTSQETFNQNWSKTITGDDAKKGYTLTVMGDVTGGNDQKVSCTVLVNGQQKSHKDASGASGMVTCDTTGIFN